jgi:uncharacterized membrane protein YdfJ with MMPL/SSD domain
MMGAWKVGATEATEYSSSLGHGYGFTIQTSAGLPLLKLMYVTEDAAKCAEAAVRKAVEGAVDIEAG